MGCLAIGTLHHLTSAYSDLEIILDALDRINKAVPPRGALKWFKGAATVKHNADAIATCKDSLDWAITAFEVRAVP